MRTTLKKVSAMFLAILMVVTMASLLVVSAEVKNGSRKLGSPESLTLGTSAQYSTLGTSKNGKYFADSIGVWGFGGFTSYAPLSNQNGIDIFVECTLGASTLYTKKNIYIDLGAWADGTSSAKWAKYGTKTITIGFNAKYSDGVLTWTAIPAAGFTGSANPDEMLQFFSFKVDPDATQGIQQIQLFTSDPVAAFVNGPSIWSGENGVWNVIFQECTQQTTDNQACTATGAPGYVRNMDAEKALWFDLFYNTHAYTKLFGYDFNIAGQTSYNSKDTNAKLDFVLTDGTLVYTEWDIASSQYVPKTTTGVTGPLDLTLLAATLPGTKTTDAYNSASINFFNATQGTVGGGFTVTKDDPRTATTSATLVPANAKITYAYTGLKGYLRLTWTTSSALTGVQTVTAAGGEEGDGAKFNLVANQSQIRTGAELEAGSLLYWEYVAFTSNYQGFGTPTLYPANQNSYADIIYKATRAVESTWSFDQKIQDLTADMNLVDATPAGKVDLQLVPIIGGDNLIAGLVETDATSTPKNLRNYGLTVNYYVDYSNAFMCQMTIDIHEKTLDTLTAYAGGKADLVVKIAEGTMVKAYSCKITQYDETFVIPLKDGTFTLLRIKVRTNYDDQVGPLAVADITDFNYSRLTLAEQVKFYPDRLYNANGTAAKDRIYGGNANKVLYVDLINAIPGSGDAYWTYNDEKVGYFRVDGFNGKNYYTALTNLLSYVGFNADGSKPNRNPVGYAKFYNTIDTSLSLTAKQLWDTSFRLVYNKGTGTTQESITEVFYPLTPAQTLKYAAADGNTYVYSVFFHTQYGDMPVEAIPLGVAQKASAKITAMGEYTYVLGLIPAGSAATKANFKAGTNPTTDTGKGFAVGQMLKTETNGTITITNYWDNTRGLATTGSGVSNYNKAITILAVRIPAGATLTVGKNGNGLNATVVDLKYGTIGLNSPDGLIDAYVTIEYASVADTAFTLTVNYDDAPDDGIKKASEGSGFKRTWDVKSTWVVRTTNDIATTNAASVAYNKFTSAVGKTLTPAAAVMPSNPNEAQVVSSTPAASTVVVSAPSDTSTPAMGNPFNAIAYIITIGASAIGGISTLIIRKRK